MHETREHKWMPLEAQGASTPSCLPGIEVSMTANLFSGYALDPKEPGG